MWLNVTRVLAALLLSTALSTPAEPTATQGPPAFPRAQFFAGIVTDLSRERVTVSRSLVGRPRENRTFL